MRIKRLTPGSVMCERMDCGRPATLVLMDTHVEQEEEQGWMVAYCDKHAGEAGYAAMMDSPAVPRQGPGLVGAEKKQAVAAS